MNWHGVEFGVKIGERLNSHDMRLTKLEDDFKLAKIRVIRVALLVLLYLGGLTMKLPSESVGEYTVGFVKEHLSLK